MRNLVVSLVAAAALLGCSEARNSTGSISQRIGEIVRTPGATEVDLAALPTFGWAYFYATSPGATREQVCQMIGAGRQHCGRIIRIDKAPDDHVFLLFGLNGQLTHVELHALANGRFDLPFTAAGHPRASAVFRIRRSTQASGTEQIWLEPK